LKFASKSCKTSQKSIRFTDKKQKVPIEHSLDGIAAPTVTYCNGLEGTGNNEFLPETS